jgi:hypothetical protein
MIFQVKYGKNKLGFLAHNHFMETNFKQIQHFKQIYDVNQINKLTNPRRYYGFFIFF